MSMKNKVLSADEAIALIGDNDVVCTTGFVQSCIPELLHAALEKRFVETQAPRNLTLIMCAGAGDSKGLGTGRLHHEGLLAKSSPPTSVACRKSHKRRRPIRSRVTTCRKASFQNSTARVHRAR